MASDPWLYSTIILGSAFLASLLILATKIIGGKHTGKNTISQPYKYGVIPPYGEARRSLTSDIVKEAKDRLKILNLEREICSYAIRRLYEAYAEGRINEEERERLSQRYKEELRRIKEEISRSESIIALDELERMQEDLIKIFNERFNEINKKIEELKALGQVEIKPAEVKEPVLTEPSKKKPSTTPRKERRRIKKAKTTQRESDADKKIERIMAEVEKVLERLSQIEVEE